MIKGSLVKARLAHFSPGRILLLSFVFAIGMGTLLLSLPAARTAPLSFLDIFFTATSATCVTGLFTIPISSFTFFGQCVILALIQIGGLGLMTLSLFFAVVFLNLGMTTRLMAGQILEFESWGKIKNFIIAIIVITFGTELLGTVLLFTQFIQNHPSEDALFYSFFHSISAFCNAGISLFDTSLIAYNTNSVLLGIFALLMIVGNCGFIVWYDIARLIRNLFSMHKGHKTFARLSLHTTLVIITSVILTLSGALVIFMLERDHLLAGFTPLQKVVNSFFMSLSARGIGFSSFFIPQALQATLFFLLPLMLIGASPGATGSGIKTTTFAVFIATVFSIIRGRRAVEIRHRTIPYEQVFKVMAILTLAICWIFCCTFILLITERHFSFMSILFETVSAFGTCGLSMGITPHLSVVGKLIIMLTMFIGRIGSLTLILALKKRDTQNLYTYPEERIMIG